MISSKLVGDEEEGPSKKLMMQDQPILGFSEADKEGTIQPHDDALVVTLQITRFDVKRVMIDKGSGVRSCAQICLRAWELN